MAHCKFFEEHIFQKRFNRFDAQYYLQYSIKEQRLITLDWYFDEGIPNVVSNGNAQTELMIASIGQFNSYRFQYSW